MTSKTQLMRALLLATVSVPVLTLTSTLAADTTVGAGQTRTTAVTLTGTDVLTIAATGALSVSSGGAVQWGAPATGAGVVINNAGLLSGPTTGATGPLITTGPAATTGTFTINNTGTIQDSFVVLSANNIPSTANLVINNSGTISNTVAGTPNVINAGGAGANFTLTNSGTIRGNVNPGIGVNTLNIVMGSHIIGSYGPNPNGTNVVNLSGAGSGYVMGRSEPPLPAQTTFFGLNNVQTMNVNSGDWTLIGGGYYNTLNIANGAIFRVCDLPTGVACAAGYDGLNGTPTDGGIGALNTSLTVVDNGTLISESNDTKVYFDPAGTNTATISGSGLFKTAGTGRFYLNPNTTVTAANVEVAGGSMIVAGNVSSIVLVDAGATLQIGSGGALANSTGTLVDNGKTGAVTGNIIANGTVNFGRLDSYSYAGVLSGNGLVTKTGSGATSLTGNNFFTGSVNVQEGSLSSVNSFKLGGADTVTVAAGATLTTSGSANPLLQWSANGTGTGIVINNAGTISGTATPTITPLMAIGAGVTAGTLTINNSGSILNGAPVLNFNGAGAGANVVITNSGLISNINQTVGSVLVGNVIVGGAGGAGFTLTNTGTIHGGIAFNGAVNTINLVTGSSWVGAFGGSPTGNNTVNLSGSGTGLLMGRTELALPGNPITFMGQSNNIQTLNVNGGTWTLIGGGYYNSLNIAAGATFYVCDVPSGVACASVYSGFNGTPTDGGLGALGTGLAIVDNGTLVSDSNDTVIDFDPASTNTATLSGSGLFKVMGTGRFYINPNMTLSVANMQIAGGTVIDAGSVASAVLVDAGATLQIGSGGTLTNGAGATVDNGKTGSVSGAITDNGIVRFARTDTYTYAGALSGNGTLVQAGSGTTLVSNSSGFSGNWDIQQGTLQTTLIKLSGANSLNIAAGATLLQTASSAIQWAANATNLSITNAGAISGPTTGGTTLMTALAGITSGTLTLANSGTIRSNGTLLNINNLQNAATNVVITNSGTLDNTVSAVAIVQNGAPVFLPSFGSVLSGGASAASITFTNSGTIHGGVTLGSGVNTVNLVTGSSWVGPLIGGAAGTNTINLSGSGTGLLMGRNEQPGASLLPTFFGQSNNIQTLNVNSGAWTLIGGGYYNSVNIASGATFTLCDVTSGAGCASVYNGANGTPTDGGIGPFVTNLAVVDNGVLISDSNDTVIDYAPSSAATGTLTGSGLFKVTGTGRYYLNPKVTVSVANVEVAGGTMVVAGNVSSAVLVDAGATLQIGSGGNLANGAGTAVDDGLRGSITGNVIDNGKTVFARADAYTYAGTISGRGEVDIVSGAVQTFTGAIANTGITVVAAATPGQNATLQIGNGGTGGTISSAQIQLGGTLSLNHAAAAATTVASNIVDGGKAGSVVHVNGITTLSGNNTYTGPTTVQAGTLILTGSNASATTVAADAFLQVGNGGTGGTTSGAIADNGTLSLNRSDAVSLAGAITGTGRIIQAGSGTSTLSDTAGFTGNWDIHKGTLLAQIVKLGGAASVNVAAGATLGAGAAIGSLMQWAANATGAGVAITNAGTIRSTATPVIATAAGLNAGTLKIANSGTIQSGNILLNFSNLQAGTSVVIDNSGLLDQATVTMVSNGQPVTLPGILMTGGGTQANLTVTNTGTIRGIVLGGNGVNTFNLVTGSKWVGAMAGAPQGTNIVNLSGAGTGLVMGKSETTGTLTTFFGALNIKTMNVNSGTWTLIGGGYYNNLNIASGATLRVCDRTDRAGCYTAYDGANGTPTDGGLGPLGSSLALVNNGTLINEVSGTAIDNDPASTAAITVTGSGKYVQSGPGTTFLSSGVTLQQKDIQVASGKLITSGTIDGAVVIDAGATLQIGTGGTLTNTSGAVLDNGKLGNVTGGIVDNGTLVFNRLDDFTLTADLSGTGGIVKMNANKVTLTGKYSFTGTTQLLGGTVQVGSLSPTSTLEVGGGTTVNLGGTTQTIGGLSDAPITGNGGTSGGTSTPPATVDLGGGALTVNQATSSSFSGNLTGGGTLTVNAGSTGSGSGGSGSGGNTLVLNGNSSSFTGTTNITGGTLQIGSSSAPTASLGGTVNVTAGKLEVGDANSSGAKLTGSVTVGSQGTLGGHGTIAGSVTNAGTTAPGGSIGTLHVAGNYTFASGSLLQQEVNANGTRDLLQADGIVTIASGATVQVQPEGTAGSYGRITNYTIVTGSRIDGIFSGVTSSNASLRPILSYGTGAVNLALVRTDVSLATLATTANQTGVAAAMNAGGALYDAVAVNTDAAVRQGLDLASGEIHASLASAILQNDGQLTDAVLRAPHGDGVTVWGEDGASWSRFDATSNTAAFRDNNLKLAGGIDLPLGSGIRIGAAGGYSRDTIAAEARSSSGRVNSFSIGGYAAAEADGLSVIGGLDYAWHNVGTTRIVAFGGVNESERADYDGNSLNLFTQVAYRIELGGGTYLEPEAGLRWSRLSTGAFSETGGLLALAGGSRQSDVAFGHFGAWLGHDFGMLGGTLSARLFGGWENANGDLTPFSAMRLANGGAFNVFGAPIGTDAAKISAQIGMRLQNIDVSLSYDGRFAARAQENAVSAHLGWRF